MSGFAEFWEVLSHSRIWARDMETKEVVFLVILVEKGVGIGGYRSA